MGDTACEHSPKDTVGKQVHLADCVDEDRWMYRRYERYVLAYFLAVFLRDEVQTQNQFCPR